MVNSGRRFRSTEKSTFGAALKRDPVRLMELVLIAIGALVSSLSAYFAMEAAYSSAEQARYAREALTAADANATFKDYIATWNRLCRAITPPEYHLTVGTPDFVEDDALQVSVSNLGFDAALFDIGAYIERVEAAEEAVRDAHLEYRTFVPEDVFARTEQAQLVTPYFYFSPDYIQEKDGVLTQIVTAAALCHYYTEEQMHWFKDKNYEIAPITPSLLRLNIEYTSNNPAAPQR
ncbi:hypothetical protein ACSV9I_14115 [Rhizobium sp. G187]|uniref:hypothetical protein n=1 Tax=Rhizobium sp. G187 TaxID=3451352 RepID=UPI003EE47BF2